MSKTRTGPGPELEKKAQDGFAEASHIFDGILDFSLAENRFWAKEHTSWAYEWEVDYFMFSERLKYNNGLEFKNKAVQDYEEFLKTKEKPLNMQDVLDHADKFQLKHWAWIYATQNTFKSSVEKIRQSDNNIPLYVRRRLRRKSIEFLKKEKEEFDARFHTSKGMAKYGAVQMSRDVADVIFAGPLDKELATEMIKTFNMAVHDVIFSELIENGRTEGLKLLLSFANIRSWGHRILESVLLYKNREVSIPAMDLMILHCNLRKNNSAVLREACQHATQSDVLISMLVKGSSPANLLNTYDDARLAKLIPYLGNKAWKTVKKNDFYRKTPEAQKRLFEERLFRKEKVFQPKKPKLI